MSTDTVSLVALDEIRVKSFWFRHIRDQEYATNAGFDIDQIIIVNLADMYIMNQHCEINKCHPLRYGE
jgi:hypothetical protein